MEFHVPKKDLIGTLQLAIEKCEIRIGKGAPWTAALMEELDQTVKPLVPPKRDEGQDG